MTMPDRDDSDRELMLARLLDQLAGTQSVADGAGTDPPIAEIAQLNQHLDEFSVEELQQLLEAGGCIRLLNRIGRSGGISTFGHDETVGHAAKIVTEKSQGDESSLNSNLPENIGRFEIKRIAGRGGFAVIYEAHDPLLKRDIALKVPLADRFESDEAIQRFQREAQLAAMLAHPNIVPVFETGIADGLHYISMGWVCGITLHEFLIEQQAIRKLSKVARVGPQGRPGGEKIAELEAVQAIICLADAIAHAHDRGVVHRDLKPANILIANADDSSGHQNMKAWFERLQITDFGLARQTFNESHVLTVEGSVIGTPAYMSPEQARTETTVGPASDIWSLGVILYELLCGESPFRRDSYLATLRSVEQDSPQPLRNIRTDVSSDIAAIVGKCLEKRIVDRYLSAFELAEDLRRFVRSDPVLVRPPGRTGRLVRWARRNPMTAGLLSATMLSLTIGCILVSWFWYQATIERAVAEDALVAAKESRQNESIAVKGEQVALAAERTAVEAVTKESKRNHDKFAFLVDSFNRVNPMLQGTANTSAAQLLRNARQDARKRFGDDPIVHADMLSNIARSFAGLGVYGEAAECRAESLKLLERQLDPNDVRTLQALDLLAAAQARAGLHSESLSTRREQLKRQRELLDSSPESERKTLTKIGVELLAIGDDVEAFKMTMELLNRRSKGDDQLDRPIAELQIKAKRKSRQLKEALELATAEVDVRRKLLGKAHPRTLLATAEMISTLQSQGELKQALNESARLCDLVNQTKRPDSALTLSLTRAHAQLLCRMKQYDKSLVLSQAALNLAIPRFGDAHPISIELRKCEANSYWEMGQRDKAFSLIDALSKAVATELGDDHIQSLLVEALLVQRLRERGDSVASVAVARPALLIARKRYGIGSRVYSTLRTQTARSLQMANRFEEALELTREWLEKKLAEDRSRIAGIVKLPVINLLVQAGRTNEAMSEIDVLLADLKRNNLSKSRAWVECSSIKAILLMERGEHDSANLLATSVLKLQPNSLAWKNLMQGILASVMYERGDAENAWSIQNALMYAMKERDFEAGNFNLRWLLADSVKRFLKERQRLDNGEHELQVAKLLEQFEKQLCPSPAAASLETPASER